MYPPGLSLLLLPGILIGIPWLVIPVTSGLLVAATVALGAELAGERAGRLAGLFMLGFPFIGFLAGTHLSHVPAAWLIVCCWLAVVRLLRSG
jgi:4-amino-4-deoxy-L-arabinose transferase-like glycosyltransferase